MTEIIIRQGTTQRFGDTRVGLSLVRGADATLVVQSGSGRVQLSLREGDLVPLDGRWQRVVSVRDGGPAKMPGASTSEIRLQLAEGPSFDASTLFVPLGATANAAGFDFCVTELATDGTARLEVWPDTFARPQTKPELIKQCAVKRGERIAAGAKALAVRDVVQADVTRGIRGWVELSV